MLTIATTFAAGVLTFTGDGTDENVVVEATGGSTVEYDDGTTLGSQTQGGVDQIIFNSNGGSDQLIFFNSQATLFSPAGGIQFNGGSGDDTLIIASGTLGGTTGTYTVAGPDSGELLYTQGGNSLDVDFSGLELIQDTIDATSLTTEGTTADETLNVIDGPLVAPVASFTQGPVILTGGDWEDNDHFENCSATTCADVTVAQEVGFLRDQSFNPGADEILAIGASPDLDGTSPGLARTAVESVGMDIGENVTHVHATIPEYSDYVTSSFTAPGSGPSSFEDISTGMPNEGALLTFNNNNSLASDDQFGGVVGNGQFDIGFDFTLYGVTDSTVAIASDGYLSTVRQESDNTDNSPDNGANQADPNGPFIGGGIGGNPIVTTPNGTIAGWWEDLAPNLGSGEVRYATLGTPGSRRFIVQYTNVQHQGGGNAVTFQIKLFENTNEIEIVYQAAPSDGGTHQVSIDHPLGITQTTAYRGTGGLTAGSGYRFSPTGTVMPEVASTPRLEDVDLEDYQVIYVATAGSQLDDYSGPNSLDLGVLADRKDDVRDYVRAGGGLYVNTQQATEAEAGNLGWLEIPDLFEVDNIGADNQALRRTPIGIAIDMPMPVQPNGNLAYHSAFLGPAGLNGLDVLVVDDSDRWITIGQGAINETIGGGDSIEINGDLTTIQVAGKLTLTVNGNQGDDSINVGQPGESLDAFVPTTLVVDGGPGTNSLTVDDSGDDTGDMVIIDDTTISGLAPFDIDPTSFNSVTVTTTGADDKIDVDYTAGGPAEATVFGSDGDDVFGSTDSIPASLHTLMSFFGGNPNGPNVPVTPPGDQLNLDTTVATEPVIIDTVGGIALSFSHLDILFGEMEDVDAVAVEDLQVGDLFVEGTPGQDRIVFNQHVLNNQIVTVSTPGFRRVYGPFFPTRKLIVYANTGNDRVETHDPQPLPVDFRGEAGNDYMASGIGDDTLLGGTGNDILLAAEGNNFIDGADGNDKLQGRSGDDIIFGGAGTDELIGNSGNDILVGGGGNDLVNGGIGTDFLDLGAGDDEANGYLGNDIILGGIGNDNIFGDADRDLVIGEGGLDRVKGDRGNDHVTGDDFNASLRSAIDADLVALLASYGQSGFGSTVSGALSDWFSGGTNDSAFQGYITDDEVDSLFGGIDQDNIWATGDDILQDFRAIDDTVM